MTKPELKQMIIGVLNEHDIQKDSRDLAEYERGKKILDKLIDGRMLCFAYKILAEWVGV